MAIDQRDITSQLRMMDDRALQQYAAMHKNDPYVFPLAFQESQNRQKIRMNGQARMAGQEQPKVNEAALMAMTPQAAPEEMGIGRLAAPNIQHMADGGIAGYGDDADEGMGMATGGMGGMFNFAQHSEPVVRMAGGGHIPRYQGVPIDDGGDGSVVDEFAGIDDQIAANMERQKMLGAFDDYSKYTPTPKPKKSSKADKKEEAKKEEPAKKVELPPLQTYTASTPEDIRRTADTMAAPEMAEIDKSYKPFAEQFAQDRARIGERERTNLSDALIRGGLKALGGKSQYAMQNISEGGLEGLNAYQEGIRTNDAARKALTQSEMLMAQAQRAERQGARRDAVQLTHQAEQAKQTGVQLSNSARQIMNTEAFQQGQLEHYKRADEASMLQARAAMSRASALGGASEDKHMLALARVQKALTDDKDYQKDAELSKFKGPLAEAAKARMKAKQREVYTLLAPELLQSLDAGKTAPPAGSGGGTNLPPLSSFYTK